MSGSVGYARGERFIVRRGRASLPHPQAHLDDDGRALGSRAYAAHCSGRHVNYIRRLCEEQRRRWCDAQRDPAEQPIEVLCEVRTRVVMLDLDALEEVLRDRRMLNPSRRQPLDV